MNAPRSHRFDAWPAADQAAWHAATSTELSVLDQGVCAHWSKATRSQAVYEYGRWLSFLSRAHRGILRQPPAARVTPERLSEFIDSLAVRVRAQTVASCIGHLINAIHAIIPAHDTTWLRQHQYRSQRLVRPRNKRARMVRASDLYALGLRLMDQAMMMPDRREAALAFRDGLIIALLITTALRRKNLAALVIGTHVERVGERYRLSISAEETKARKHIELLLSNRLTPYIQCYLSDYRLRLNGADRHNGLWSSTKGGSLGSSAIYDAVCRRTREAFGKVIYLHLFRDIAATTIGDDAPGAIHLARDLLGHTKLAMTDKHYRHADRLVALRRHTALLETLRAKNSAMVRTDGQAGRSQ